ncbi:MAG: hypothetical protein A2W33_06805 [Chloroflexi bacterium RBG_16_52_11]|nr:MAG: hypothetical protein A2W33_06805 [Chloroflexi bacterium RBG_16_52_11]
MVHRLNRYTISNQPQTASNLFSHPILLGMLAFGGYSLATLWYTHQRWDAPSIFTLSVHPYFNYLADAFNHGQLHLREIPLSTLDLALYNGRYYLYWSPFPAVLLMPFIIIFGAGFSDILFSLLIAATNVGLTATILRNQEFRRIVSLSDFKIALISLFFAFGTVHFFIVFRGEAWYTSQLVAYLCAAFAYWGALAGKGRLAFLFAGIGIACAMMTRLPLIVLGLWPGYHLYEKYKDRGRRWLLSSGLLFLFPILLSLGLYTLYNYARFGNPFEIGYSYHLMNEFFVEDYQKYGAFNLHYVPINFYYQYIYYPFPLTGEILMGGSLFLLSPLFFGAFFSFRNATWKHALVLTITILLTSVPIFLIMGTGWPQFGPRYTLDFTLPLLLMTAMGIRNWSNILIYLLALISIVHYILGIYIFIP